MAANPDNDLYIRRDVIVDIDFGKRRDDVWALAYLVSDPFLNVQLISLSGNRGKEDVEALRRLLSFLGRENIPISLGNVEEGRPSAMVDFLKETEDKDFSVTFFSSSIEAYSEILPRLNKPIVLALGAFDSLAIVRPFLKKYHASIVLFGGMLKPELPVNPEYRISDISAARSLINDPELDVSILSYDSCARLSFNEKDGQSIKAGNTRLAIALQENEAVYSSAKPSDPLPALAAAWYLRYPVNFDIVVENVKLSEDGYLLNQGGTRPIPIIKSYHKDGYMKSVFLNAILADDGIKSDIQIIKGDHCTMVYPAIHPSAHLSVYETGWEKHRAEDRVGPLARDLYIIHFLIDGNCRYQTENAIKVLGKGDCFLIPPNEVTTLDFHFENPAEYYWVAFHGSEASGIVAQCGFNRENGFALHAQDAASVLEIMKALVMVKSGGTGTAYYLLGQLYLLLSKMALYTAAPDGKKIDYVKEAIRFMNENFDRGISVSEVCSHVNVERSYFFRIFKNDTGFSPREYLISLRLERAKQLLRETQKPIASIGSMVGYPNYVSFCNIFTHRAGVSPSQYRSNHQGEKQ